MTNQKSKKISTEFPKVKLEKASGDYFVMESGSMISFNEGSPFLFRLNFEDGFYFIVEVFFTSDSTGQKKLDRKVEAERSLISITCTNFDNEFGTGTAEAVKLLTYKGWGIFFQFWVYKLGNTPLRRIDYSFYRER